MQPPWQDALRACRVAGGTRPPGTARPAQDPAGSAGFRNQGPIRPKPWGRRSGRQRRRARRREGVLETGVSWRRRPAKAGARLCRPCLPTTLRDNTIQSIRRRHSAKPLAGALAPCTQWQGCRGPCRARRGASGAWEGREGLPAGQHRIGALSVGREGAPGLERRVTYPASVVKGTLAVVWSLDFGGQGWKQKGQLRGSH